MASRKSTITTNIEANSEGFLKAMDDVKRSISLTRIEFKNINEVMKLSEDSTDALREHKKLLQTELKNTSSNLATLNKGLEESIEKNGVDSEATRIAREEVQKASTHYYNLQNELDKVNNKLEEQTFSLKSVSNTFEKVSDVTGKFASKVKWLSGGAASILGLSAKTAVEYEDAFVGVKKTVEGTDEELEQIRLEIMDLSKQIPIGTQSLFELAEEAGQLGIATKDVSSFTEVMAKLGSATNLSAVEAGEAIATFVNVMGTASENYERIGSVIVKLGNNSKATEADIVAMSQRMSGAAATMGMTEADVLGLATALSSVGLEAEMGGTAISRVMNDFNRAASGVETKYGTLSQYAQICGMSTKQFADAVKNNAGEAMKQFVIGLGDSNRTGKETIQLMSDLGINEVRLTDTMLRLANASGTVDQYMQMANEEWKENNALNDEASKKFADTASQIEITKNRFGEVADKLGKILLPVLNDGLKFVGNLTDKFSKLSTGTQKTIIQTLAFTTALYPASKAVSVISKNVGEFTKFLDKNSKPFKTLYTNITDVNSRTIDLSQNVKNSNSLFTRFTSVLSKAKTGSKDLKTSITSVNSKLKENATQLKEGITYWNQTASSADKLKVGITGLVGTAVSLKGFSESIKSISDEGANFGNVAGSVVSGISSIASAASTGASIGGPFGAVIGGIGASIGLVVTGISSWVQANDNAKANLEATQSTFTNFKTSIDSINDSYNQNILNIQNSTTSQMMYISKMQELSTELANFIDVNGRVKDSDSERANVIMTLLNESLGTQLTLEDGVIRNGGQIIANKQQFIDLTNQSAEAIKKETLLEGYQSQYKDAIDSQTQAKKVYNDALAKEAENIENAIQKYKQNELSIKELEKIVNESSTNKQAAEKKYQGVLNSTDSIINGLNEVTKKYSNGSATELEETINKITSTNHKAIEENSKSYEEAFSKAKETSKLAREEAKTGLDEIRKTFETPSKFEVQANFKKARTETNRFVNDYNSSMSGANVQFSRLRNVPGNALGNVITKPTLSWVAEDGAEAIIPLEKHTEWINGVASKLSSELNTEGINNNYMTKLDNAFENDYLSSVVNLLERILAKPTDFYVDGRKLSEITATTDDVASGNLLEKVERGWAI